MQGTNSELPRPRSLNILIYWIHTAKTTPSNTPPDWYLAPLRRMPTYICVISMPALGGAIEQQGSPPGYLDLHWVELWCSTAF